MTLTPRGSSSRTRTKRGTAGSRMRTGVEDLVGARDVVRVVAHDVSVLGEVVEHLLEGALAVPRLQP